MDLTHWTGPYHGPRTHFPSVRDGVNWSDYQPGDTLVFREGWAEDAAFARLRELAEAMAEAWDALNASLEREIGDGPGDSELTKAALIAEMERSFHAYRAEFPKP